MNASNDLPPQFLKKSDLGKDGIVLTIKSSERKNVSRNYDESDYRYILTFKEGYRFQLNFSNLRTVIDLCGEETDGWPGQRLGFYYDSTIKFEGEKVGGIRVISAPEIKPTGKPLQEPDEIPF
jgi:hypothetical protein